MTAAVQAVDIELRGAALALLSRRDQELLISGPAGTGKSRACMIKLHLAALKYPGADLLVVRKTAKSLSSSFTTEWEDLIKEAMQAGIVRFWGPTPRRPAQYRYSNGSTVTLGGLDDPIKIMSTQRDIVYVQEATEVHLADWDAMNTRLRAGNMPYQQLLADCNPSAEAHWLKQRANSGKTSMLISTHRDNPRYFRADGTPTDVGAAYLERLDNLSGVRLLRLRDGVWAAAEGVIYEEWNPAIHLLDAFDIPAEWPRYWVVDFGFTNPFVLQRWAEDPDGRLYLYAETYRTNTLVEDHARAVLAEVTDSDGNWTEPRPQAVICDHDAEGRETLYRHLGLTTTAAKKDVLDGIQAVQARLRPAGDGRPRLFLLRGARTHQPDVRLTDAKRPDCTEQEFPEYVWDITDGKPPKEAPVKENDHGLDATRYLVAHRDLQSKPRVRWM